jgi:predicted Zn finger-like uncharacterized protein
MSRAEQHRCPTCGAVHELHRHQLTAVDRASLRCPHCSTILVSWHGQEFLTYGRELSPPVPPPQAGNVSPPSEQ